MSSLHRKLGTALAVIGVVACGDKDDRTMKVQGTVSSRVTLDHARAVAIGRDGRVFWAYLDNDRDFTLKLPAGQSYRILIANGRSGGGQTIVGRLVVDRVTGKTHWLGVNDTATVDLGNVRPMTTTTTSGTTITPRCVGCTDDADDEDGGYGKSNHDDDYATHQNGDGDDDDDDDDDSDADDSDVCSDGTALSLEPSTKPNALRNDADDDDDDDNDNPCAPTAPPASPPPAGGGGAAPEGGTCAVSTDCATGLTCLAAKCAALLN